MEIAVRDAFIVGFGNTFGQLTGDANGIFDAQRTARNGLSQCFTIIARHANKEAPVRSFINVMDCANIGMIECGCSAGFTNELLSGVIVSYGRRGDTFQRDRTAEVLILSTVDLTHAAGANLADNTIVGDSLSDIHGIHGRLSVSNSRCSAGLRGPCGHHSGVPHRNVLPCCAAGLQS